MHCSDLERAMAAHNDVVARLAWTDLQVLVPDRRTGRPLPLLTNMAGLVRAGEMLAIMGPSGGGKTTLLNVLAQRTAAAGATTMGQMTVNGQPATHALLRDVAAYVEQDDALIGSVTARETVLFAARLSLGDVSRKDALRRVDDLLASVGLLSHADTLVGTPLKKGLSGGQKKRLSVASRLVAQPAILFLDEPTSGLDSALSVEVIRYMKEMGKRNNLLIIASIHQPSTATFQLFDKLALLSAGRTCYFGPVATASDYFARIGFPPPPATNPAEFFLDLVQTDLDRHGDVLRTEQVLAAWAASETKCQLDGEISEAMTAMPTAWTDHITHNARPGTVRAVSTLLHRAWLKACRDVVVYTVRVAMYLGLAVLMGTVFLRMHTTQEYIQPFVNAIFFGGAFLSFMAVAYVPAFLEDVAVFRRERADGLVGPLGFLIANFLIGLPFLFFITVLFSSVTYWLSNFRPNGIAFLRWILWLFLDLLAAESLVVLVASLVPIFVGALAVTAFANGLWMVVGGFLVPLGTLNVFYRYVFHYVDYQAYVFQGMMVNEFAARIFACDATAAGFQCAYAGDRNSEGIIEGVDVLRYFGIATGREGIWLGILVGIIVGYRALAYLVLRWRY